MKMITSKTFWTAFWSGLATPGMVVASDLPKISRVEYPVLKNSRDAMRSDWVKIGKDFDIVIKREAARQR